MSGAGGVGRCVATTAACVAACLAPATTARAQASGRAAVRVTDAAGHPLAGASVRLTPQPDSAVGGTAADTVVTTDATGSVEIGGLQPGPYRVRVTHPAIARGGVEPPTTGLVVVADSLAARSRVTIAPPSLAALAARCGVGQLADTVGLRIVYGTAVDATTTRADGAGPAPAASARITAAWTLYEGGRSVRRVTADVQGTFVVCGVPEGATPTLGVEEGSGRLAAAAQRVAFGPWRAAFASLELRPPAPEFVPLTIAVVGTITDSVASVPLSGAVVQMVDVAHPAGRVYEATADSAGAFTIADIPPGRYVVHFEHPALADYGVEVEDHLSELQPGWREVRIALAGPTAAQVLARACPQAGDGAGLLLGRVRVTNDRVRVVTGRVRASWNRGAQGVAGVVGSGGVFRLCGVPRATRVVFTVDTPPGWKSAPREVLTGRQGVTVTDVVVEAPL